MILVIACAVVFSCQKDNTTPSGSNNNTDCDGYGYLKVKNESYNTLQKLLIDGAGYGTLDPGETKTVKLAAGRHDWELRGVSGGGGCNPASVIIIACQTESFSCSGK